MEYIENTAEFQTLVVAARGTPERSMGDSVIPAEPAQWAKVKSLASELLSRAEYSLALHVYLVQAEANLKGMTGFQAALSRLLNLLEQHWDEIDPAPDLDDPDDRYYARVNLINELSEQPAFLDAIYRVPLVSVRGIGEFSTRCMDIATGTLSGNVEDQERCQEGLIRAAFAQTDPVQIQLMADCLATLHGLCGSVEAVFAQKSEQQNSLSLQRLQERIGVCSARFAEYGNEYMVASAGEQVAGSTEFDELDEPQLGMLASPVVSCSLADRKMVQASFNAILMYYQRFEPSSPVRLLTVRVADLVDKSFFEVLQAMAPTSKEDFPALLRQLQKQPLAILLRDSYMRYLSGEGVLAEVEAKTETEAIESRQQVLDVMQDIESYFSNNEPASPVPVLVAEIRKLVPKHFTELIAQFCDQLPAAVAGTE